MCPLSIYCVLSTPLIGGVRATLQTLRPSNPLSNSAPVPHGALCTSSLLREAPLHAEAIQILGVRAQEDRSSSKYYIRYVPGPTCRGSALLYMSPFGYKRGGMRRCNTSTIFRFRPKSSKTTQAFKQYNTQWSRVLRSGGPNHSKLLRVLVFIPSSHNKQNA
jgi:hypothetical protein